MPERRAPSGSQAEGELALDPADREAILATAADYIESWLDGDAARMARCLHPELAKRSPSTGPGVGAGVGEIETLTGDVETLTRDDMIAATAKGLGTRYARPWEAIVLDAYRRHRDGASPVVRLHGLPPPRAIP